MKWVKEEKNRCVLTIAALILLVILGCICGISRYCSTYEDTESLLDSSECMDNLAMINTEICSEDMNEFSIDMFSEEISIDTAGQEDNLVSNDKVGAGETSVNDEDINEQSDNPSENETQKKPNSNQVSGITQPTGSTQSKPASSSGTGGSADSTTQPSGNKDGGSAKPSTEIASSNESPVKPDETPEVKPDRKPEEKTSEKPVSSATEQKHTHSYTSKITKEATCTAEGVKTYICSCGDSYTENTAKAAHSFVTTTTRKWIVDKAAYDEQQKVTITGYICNDCGKRFTSAECKAGQLSAHQKETDHAGSSSFTDFTINIIHHAEVGHYEEIFVSTCSNCYFSY